MGVPLSRAFFLYFAHLFLAPATQDCLNASSQQTVVRLLNFLEIEGQQAYSRSFFCCSSNNSQSFFHFSLLGHSFAFQCTMKVSVLYKSNFLCVNCPFHSLWSRERQLPAVLNLKTIDSFPVNNCCSLIWLRRAKQTHVMCNFLYFLMIGWVLFA